MKLFKDSEEIVNFTVDNNVSDIKKFLGEKNLSSRLFRKLYKKKHIYVNGKFLRKGLEIKKGDQVSIYMEGEIDNTLPEDIDIDIVYEDHDLLILNKQPNMVVHLTRSHQNNTLSNGIANYFRKNNIKRKIRFVNRLDMDTTGLLIVAKNPFAHQQMALQFNANQVDKKYLAIVSGMMEKDEDYINCPIGKEERSIRRVVTPNGQKSLSKYTVKERYEKNTLVDVQIFTGRSHQIRVHLSHLGHPIVGDHLYGEESHHIKRQALHSYYLKIRQPRTKEEIEIVAPLPYDMLGLIKQLKNK